MGMNFTTAYDQLTSAWNRHESLKRAGAPTAQLWASRRELDEARLTAHRARR